MKKLFIISAAAIALASCSNDDVFTGETSVTEETGAPITFSSASKGFSRAGDFVGADAAEKLGSHFVVEGWKGTKTSNPASIVYDNYLVEYQENSAETTESNSSNWEYVGVEPIKHATDNGILKQTIKFWDYTQPQYDFIAWSAGTVKAIYEGTPADGEVLVTAVDYKQYKSDAYSMTGKAKDLANCYIADLVTVKKTDYQKPVTFAFRSLGTKVRIALYETIPGYSVKDVEFYSGAKTNDANAATAKLFTTEDNAIYTNGTYTIGFPSPNDPSNPDYNKAHVTFTRNGDQAKTIDWGKLSYTMAEAGEKSTDPIYLGRTSSTASYAGEEADNYYVAYIPNETGTNLNLRVNYTLESIDGSGETIKVQGATAQVPQIYTSWKPGYAYTYVFKISDKTNGTTGKYDPTNPEGSITDSDPAGLYPITFDAFVEDAEEDGIQETVTTVSAPSFTTYAKGTNVVNKNEYAIADAPIFVTINENNALVAMVTETEATDEKPANVALYKVTTKDGTEATEALVNNSMSKQDPDLSTETAIVGRNKATLTEVEFTTVNTINFGADGNAIVLDGKKAASFTPEEAGTYALVYTQEAPETVTPKYEVQSFEAGESVKGYYRCKFITAVTNGLGTNNDVQKGISYFTLGDDGVYTKITPFLGQVVNNLYLDNKGTTPAKGYSKSYTDYYYTIDGGKTYTLAHPVMYSQFKTATLYVLNGTTYSVKEDAEPVNGRAYYYYDEAKSKYIYCVIEPQQTDDLYVINKNYDKSVKCADDEVAIKDYLYLDKYTVNDGVYYSKVIKIQ